MIDSDGVRGVGSNVTITSNTFDHALRGNSDNHNDFVQILAGGPWKITRNKFGDRNNGGGQVFLKPLPGSGSAIHDVYVASNIFYGNMPFAMQIGPGNGTVPPARNDSIVNNTILSGSAAAVRVCPKSRSCPPTSGRSSPTTSRRSPRAATATAGPYVAEPGGLRDAVSGRT